MWKFIVDVVHDFVSSLQPDVGRGFLHVSNVFLYNMEYKIIKKIRQNTAWIEADILGKNFTPDWCNALAPAIVYVSNDVTIPFNAVTSQ